MSQIELFAQEKAEALFVLTDRIPVKPGQQKSDGGPVRTLPLPKPMVQEPMASCTAPPAPLSVLVVVRSVYPPLK